MKKFAVLIFFMMASYLAEAQTVVTLPLPNPCSITAVEKPADAAAAELVIAVSPNPNAGFFTLEIQSPLPLGRVIYRITDMRGRELSSETLYAGHTSLIRTLVVSHLPDGIYILVVTTSQSSKSVKIVKQKNN